MIDKASSPVRIGLIGFGNIGTGVVRWLRKNQALINSRLPRPVELARIADIDIETDRGITIDKSLLTTRYQDITEDPGIDIVIELVGGTGIANEIVRSALNHGKHVVTANKALLATYGADLMVLAREKGVAIGPEASVGAGIPLIRPMHQSLACNRYTLVAGIVNGTANYILTEMEQTGKAFQEVLSEAQRLGYAEPDPTFDIEGIDTAHKIAVLSSLAFEQDIRIGDVAVEGVSRLRTDHLQWAAAHGLRIKLVAMGRQSVSGEVDVWVAPTLVPLGGELASVGGPFNAVIFDGEPIGKVLMSGRGAGQESTSSGVLSDVMALAAAIDCGGIERECVLNWPQGKKHRMDPGLSEGEFVLCLEASDAPGGLSSVFAQIEKSALPVRQVECTPSGDSPQGFKGSGLLIWIETARTQMREIQKSIDLLLKAGVLRDRPQVFRLERDA